MTDTARPARTAADDLRVVVDHWTHMRALIDTSTPEVWTPPRTHADYLRTLDEHHAAEVALEGTSPADFLARPGETGDQDATPGARDHLVLAEQSAPLRLHVVDACRAVEAVLCALADEIAAEVQRSKVAPPHRANPTDPVGRDLALLAARDEADPARWHYNLGTRSAVRAAEWLLARLDDEAGPCRPLNGAQRERITRIAREAARRVERTIGIEQRREFPMSRPCPWCGAALTMHRGGSDASAVTCANGADCGAPVLVVEGRRTWAAPHELASLETALEAAAHREKRAAARRRQRAAAQGRSTAA
ncbi:hypothetical protein [Streptomyces sp. WAC 01529]|uniref:hypothetical protein n=1 Tax=Streptomyces sp. WAC 01529 TaxID=2203205 RepID=UPI001F0C5117|nr:hypothetical protein [Streptomyces sp. WAC 01529]